MSHEEKVKLKDLYLNSLNKWEEILRMFDKNVKEDYFIETEDFFFFYNDYCLTACSFCNDSYSNCKKCLIDHYICDDLGSDGLIREGDGISDIDEFRNWVVEMVDILRDNYNNVVIK